PDHLCIATMKVKALMALACAAVLTNRAEAGVYVEGSCTTTIFSGNTSTRLYCSLNVDGYNYTVDQTHQGRPRYPKSCAGFICVESDTDHKEFVSVMIRGQKITYKDKTAYESPRDGYWEYHTKFQGLFN
ncbi:hypothetical protein EC991_009922, partial [Linnemannia zychae]